MQTSLGDPTGSKEMRAPRVLEKQPVERIPLQPKEATSRDRDVVIGTHGERITPGDLILAWEDRSVQPSLQTQYQNLSP